jgi:hypothetical protein
MNRERLRVALFWMAGAKCLPQNTGVERVCVPLCARTTHLFLKTGGGLQSFEKLVLSRQDGTITQNRSPAGGETILA